MANNNNPQEKPSLGQEILSFVGVAGAVFILICLAGFTIPDPAAATETIMWGGKVGYFLSQVLMSFLGISSFWLVILLLVFSLQFFSPTASFKRLPYISVGCSGIIIASSGLLAALKVESLAIFGHSYPVAGYLGRLLHGLAGKYFGGPGAILIFTTLFIVSMMVAVELSPYLWVKNLAAAFANLLGLLRKRYNNRPAKEAKDPAALTVREINVESDPAQEPLVEPQIFNNKPPALDFDDDLINELPPPTTVRLTEDDDDDGFQPLAPKGVEYKLPSISLLDIPANQDVPVDKEHYFAVSKKLEEKLRDFGVHGKVSGISPGPIITTYEFSPAPGVKINKIVSLADDLALGLKAESVRIVGSIPGKAALGIEIPNPVRQTVYAREIMGSDEFLKSTSKLTIGLGMDVIGNPVMANLAKMPHLLIAGATGSGKSVAINTIICSILFNATPDDVRLLMVDPKRIELSSYEDIPHLLHPVVVDPKMASRALQWAVKEMERRYCLLEVMKVKNITSYNEVADERLPLIVIIIDELADLMMVCSRDVEGSVARLAQMARAAGMHLILATQRPSVDVLTGLIKANFPTRMSFKVSSKIDSRTIIDTSGAEHLLGNGDMLFLPPGASRLQRIHGAYISEKETERVVDFLKAQGSATYEDSMLQIGEDSEEGETEESEYDERYDEAVAIVCDTEQASISMLQRRLRVGYNRAARMIEVMEKEGVVGPPDGSKPRQVLVKSL